jgi:hypothetical protein
MASQVQICNMALSRVGVAKKIESIDEVSNEAQECKLWFDQCRDEVLSAAQWPFATKYENIVQSEVIPLEEWDYAYNVPSDMLSPIGFGANGRSKVYKEKFQIGYSSVGQVIMTDAEPPQVFKYIVRITDVSMFAADFVNALAWRLAQEVATPLTDNPEWADRAEKKYRQALDAACANYGNAENADDPLDAECIRARQ